MWIVDSCFVLNEKQFYELPSKGTISFDSYRFNFLKHIAIFLFHSFLATRWQSLGKHFFHKTYSIHLLSTFPKAGSCVLL